MKLGLPDDPTVILVLTGGGGSGTPFAPLTMGARAVPDALWLVAGPLHRRGHETDFANLRELGWVSNVTDHIAAADIVIASAGDNTVHEIARVGAKFVRHAGMAILRRAAPQGDALLRSRRPLWTAPPGPVTMRPGSASRRCRGSGPCRSSRACTTQTRHATRPPGWRASRTSSDRSAPARLTVVAAE